ncbi:Transglycosylase SLT domain-containing protein [Actinopolyspora xinjiangensis]|uniref:Transglycosylase SLT domain-containing protein n=2 Tax=Actinopolyspora xinjiangensis TaxID=405564 RepID=A0A1H0QKK4_9ACTN|nr:lytic murein transglycosylase [Actinopolyspora xinjiangensis]SDP17802.1 Transglycosylase SLT domain-containing protein [Actinopolyspora xinjiangensis]
MPRRRKASDSPIVLLSGLAMLAVLVLLAGLLDGGGRHESSRLPTATAPPRAGAQPPDVRPLPGAADFASTSRPQRQLADWAGNLSEELNIPLAALEAYGYAELALERTRPDCGLSWSVLAGIGAVESGHGRYGGADLDSTARPEPPIRGVPLDGSEGVRLIRDTDGGKLDGDSTYDRAVGPLQFIPSTWRTWGRDGDADGEADPDDLDDAALAAGYYLCDSGNDLRRAEQFRDSVLRYNASGEYVQQVLDHADDYGKRSRELLRKR